LSSLQIALGENHGIADYILLPRRREDAELLNPATPVSVQQSNSLPPSPRLFELPPPDMIPLQQIDPAVFAVQILEEQDGLPEPVMAPLPELVQDGIQEQEAVAAAQEIVPEVQDLQPAPVIIPLQDLI
jgi:hypothetical protein